MDIWDVAARALGVAGGIALLGLSLRVIVRERKRQQSMKPRDQIGETEQDTESRP